MGSGAFLVAACRYPGCGLRTGAHRRRPRVAGRPRRARPAPTSAAHRRTLSRRRGREPDGSPSRAVVALAGDARRGQAARGFSITGCASATASSAPRPADLTTPAGVDPRAPAARSLFDDDAAGALVPIVRPLRLSASPVVATTRGGRPCQGSALESCPRDHSPLAQWRLAAIALVRALVLAQRRRRARPPSGGRSSTPCFAPTARSRRAGVASRLRRAARDRPPPRVLSLAARVRRCLLRM